MIGLHITQQMGLSAHENTITQMSKGLLVNK